MFTSTSANPESKAHLLTHGYAIFRAILDRSEVDALRKVCWDYYTRTGTAEMPPADFITTPELSGIPFDSRVVTRLQELLGKDYTMFPDFNVRTNLFGTWHTDSASEGRQAYKYAPDYLFVKCGLFLQDNDPVNGGGIDLVPGGFRLRVGDPTSLVSELLRRMYFYARPSLTLDIKAGDLVCFDSRVFHRSTRPKAIRKYGTTTTRLETDATIAKHVIYWDASRSTHVQRFVENGLKRAETDRYFRDTWSIRYPQHYAEFAVQQVRSHGIHVASA